MSPSPDAAIRALPDDPDDIARAFARALSGRDGEIVMAQLRAMTVERRLGPEASEALLRHVEGQRALVAAIESLRARGRGPNIS